MGKVPDDIGPTAGLATSRRRSALARVGLVTLAVGTAMLLAGCYRGVVELSEGRIRPLLPIAVGAPLAAELLLLVALVLLACAALLLGAARRRRSR